jgi:DNA (cytosine-5)-methyltransferase 1
MAFEEEGFVVVRGPDVLWGGDVRRFHPPAGRFDGVIGGPPCQAFSILRNLNPRCGAREGNLIPEFERVVAEAKPGWFVMENVRGAPVPSVPGYATSPILIRDVWFGGQTNRQRRLTFGGSAADAPKHLKPKALHTMNPEPAVLASASVRTPVKIGGSGKVKRTWEPRPGNREKGTSGLRLAIAHQGLPPGFDLPPFTVTAKLKAIGNGVPLPMGRAVARAVRKVVAMLALALALPACAARQSIPIAAGADLVTTEVVIARGGVELNPIPPLQTTGGRVALKAAGTAFLVWLCERLEADGHHTTAEILKWTAVGAWGGAAVWNANVARTQ